LFVVRATKCIKILQHVTLILISLKSNFFQVTSYYDNLQNQNKIAIIAVAKLISTLNDINSSTTGYRQKQKQTEEIHTHASLNMDHVIKINRVCEWNIYVKCLYACITIEYYRIQFRQQCNSCIAQWNWWLCGSGYLTW